MHHVRELCGCAFWFCISHTFWMQLAWVIADLLSNIFLMTSHHNNFIIGKSETHLTVLIFMYSFIFVAKVIFYSLSWYKTFQNKTSLPIKYRLFQLWFLSILSAIFAIIICGAQDVHNKHSQQTILAIHTAVITKHCFFLLASPLQASFQSIISVLFGCDFLFVFMVYDKDGRIFDLFVLTMCFIFFLSISVRPLTLLIDSKPPNYILKQYPDYYASDDGAWKADETPNRFWFVPPVSRNNSAHFVCDNAYETSSTPTTAMSAIPVIPLSYDMISPSHAPSRFEQCFYLYLCVVFCFFIQMPSLILLMLSFKVSMIVIEMFVVVLTIYVFGIIILLLLYRLCDYARYCSLFWFLFSKKYFETITENKRRFYSSLGASIEQKRSVTSPINKSYKNIDYRTRPKPVKEFEFDQDF